jgi:hypothetical protein
MTVSVDQTIAAAYVAFFGRAPDQQGLQFWQNAAQSSGLSGEALMENLAAGFANNPSFASIYSGMSNAAFVTAIYQNIGGTAPDAAGAAYWTALLNGGESRATVVADFVYGVLNMTTAAIQAEVTAGTITSAEATSALQRQAYLTNQSAVALDYTNTLGAGSDLAPTTNQNDPASVAQDPAYVASKAILSGVTADPATAAAAEAYLGSTPTPTNSSIIATYGGTTYTLTTGVDNITLTGNNNVVNATDEQTVLGTSEATWTALDSITGTGTGNTFNIVTAESVSVPAGATVSGIQTLNVIESSTGVSSSPFISGETTINLDTSTGFTGLQTLNVTTAGEAISDYGTTTLVAAATTNVNVTATPAATFEASAISVDGGNNVTVNSNGDVTIGQTTAPVGAITVNESGANFGGEIQIDGGTSVTVTASGTGVGIDIGDTTAPTGTITVNVTGTTNFDGIDIGSGSTVNVTAAGTNVGQISVGNESAVTGAVTVNLTDTVSTTPTTDSHDNSIEVYGGTTVSVTQNIDAPSVLGSTGNYYYNEGGGVDIYGSSATTSVTVNQSAAVEDVEGVAAADATPAVAAVGGVYDGYVDIDDVNGDTAKLGTITSVTLNNFSDGAYIEDNALTTLTIGGTAGGLEIDDTGGLATPVTTLALNVNALTATPGDMGPEATYDTTVYEDAGVIKTLNIVTGGASASTLTFADSGLTTLNISGSQNINLTTTNTDDTAAVYATAINVSGAAGVTTAIGAATAFDSTGTGNDVLTLNGALTKTSGGSIVFGSGDNSLLADAAGLGSIGAGVTVNGGTSGDNTISASLVNAGNAAGITNFQVLDVSNYYGTLDASLLSTPVTGVSITSTYADATLLNLASNVTVTDSSDNTDSDLTLTHAGTGTNSLAVNFEPLTTAGGDINSITSTGDTTVSFSSDGALTLSGGGYNDIGTLSETDNVLTTVSVKGATAFEFDTSNGINTNTGATTATADVASSLKTIDASATTGGISVDAGHEVAIGGTTYYTTYTGLTIHGGTGGDYIVNEADSGVIIEGATKAGTQGYFSDTGYGNELTVDGSHATINDSASAATDELTLNGASDTATLGSGNNVSVALNGYSNTATLGSGTGVAVTVADDTFGTAVAPATTAPLLGDTATVTFGSGTATVTDNLHFNLDLTANPLATNGDMLVLNGSLAGNAVAFADGNTLTFANTTTTANQLGNAVTLSSSVTTLQGALAAATSTTPDTVQWFQYGGNTYVVDSGAQTTTPGTTAAQVVKIAGTVDLSHDTLHLALVP